MIQAAFKQWCKETGRSGGVMVGSSLKEFFQWYEKDYLDKLSKIMSETKYRFPLGKDDKAIWLVDIPKVIEKLKL